MDGAKFLDCFHGTSLRTAYEKIKGLPSDKGRSRLTDVDQLLKLRFWDLVEESVATGEKASLASLHTNICTYTHFYQNVINNPFKFRWLLTPDNREQSAAIQNLAFKKIRKILSLPLQTADGEFHVGNSKLLLAAVRVLAKLR